jgi:hypothetical protein
MGSIADNENVERKIPASAGKLAMIPRFYSRHDTNRAILATHLNTCVILRRVRATTVAAEKH